MSYWHAQNSRRFMDPSEDEKPYLQPPRVAQVRPGWNDMEHTVPLRS